MEKREQRSLLAIPVVIILGIGIAFAGSQNGYSIGAVPIFALSVALAFTIQWIAFIPAYLRQTEVFFDLTGGLTYITVAVVAVVLSPAKDGRSLLLMAMIVVWAGRLGLFLFSRIKAAGEDRRFRELKPSFPGFLLTWTTQGLWVAFTLAAALAAITTVVRKELGLYALAGFLVWAMGFAIEVVADQQKRKFSAAPENAGKFISTGLWSWSRHPNYFGEIVLWIGVAIVALPVLSGWGWVTLISPVFVTILLTRISGVPMLEAYADEKWGGQDDYEAYKAATPVLIPRPPKKR